MSLETCRNKLLKPASDAANNGKKSALLGTIYTTPAHLAVSALLALLITRRTSSALLGKMGLVSDGLASLEKRPY